MPIRKEVGGGLAPRPRQAEPTGALRHNQDKAPIHLVAPSILTAIARVSAHGVKEYGERNWEKGFEYSVMYSSLMRHLIAWWEGQDIDPKSGLPHIDHIAWNTHAIVEHDRRLKNGSLPLELDDRPCNTVEGYNASADRL